MVNIKFPNPVQKLGSINKIKRNLLRKSNLTEEEAEDIARSWIQKEAM